MRLIFAPRADFQEAPIHEVNHRLCQPESKSPCRFYQELSPILSFPRKRESILFLQNRPKKRWTPAYQGGDATVDGGTPGLLERRFTI